MSNLSELSDRAVDSQGVGRNHRYVVRWVPELSQGRAGLVMYVATMTGTHGHAAGGLGLRALPDDSGAGRRGQQHGRRRRQSVRGTDAAAAANTARAAATAAAVPVANRAADHDAASAADALPRHRSGDAVALAPQTLTPVDGQVPAMQLDVRHGSGSRAPVVWRPAFIAAAQRRRRVPQVPVVLWDQ